MWKTPVVLIFLVFLLLALGIVMLASTSGIKADAIYGDPNFFVKRQGLWMGIALAAGALAARIPYRLWRPAAPLLLGLALALLAAVLVPGLGVKIGGARRWFHVGGFSFQPSELAKFSLLLALAWWMAREKWHIGEFRRGAVLPMVMVGAVAGLIFLEPDYGTTLLSGVVGLAMLFVGGARVLYLSLFGAVGAIGFALAVLNDPVRWNRIIAFLRQEQFAQTYSFQLVSSINAFIAGGPLGVGLGNSIQKHYYLPEAHTDFIFAIIGEELGVGATLGVVALFAAILVCGLRISLRAADTFGRLLAFGITLMIALQAMINIGVVVGLLPTKGLPLPFISAGGSSLVLSLVQIGVLYNIGLHGRDPVAAEESRPIKDQIHHF